MRSMWLSSPLLFFLPLLMIKLEYLIIFHNPQLDYCSSNIEMVVDEERKEEKSNGDSPLCAACQMAVSWMRSQIQNDGVKEKVLNYVNQVNLRYYAKNRNIRYILFF